MANSPCADIYQFKISLKYIKPPIWRRILVPKNYTFQELHRAIINAMGWCDTHLHTFLSGRNIEIGVPSPEDHWLDKEVINEATVKIKEYFKVPKDSMKHVYDFGDNWEHSIVLEKIIPAVEGQSYPICIAGKRACPPEDVGGVYGYQEHLEIMADPHHPEHEERKDWLKELGREDWDAEKFDPKSVNFLYF